MQFDRRIGATMNEVTNGVGLDRGLSELPDLPQSVELGRKIDRRGWMLNVSVEEAEASLVRTGRSLETTLREQSRGDACDCGPAGMHTVGPCAFLKKNRDAGRGACSDSLGSDDVLRRQSKQTGRNNG